MLTTLALLTALSAAANYPIWLMLRLPRHAAHRGVRYPEVLPVATTPLSGAFDVRGLV